MNIDTNIKELERKEFIKRDKELCLIPSEGFPSEDVLNACGSVFGLKYAEGRSGHRYYCGCEIVDEMESLCEKELLKLFKATKEYKACVQPHSGTQANMIVYGSFLQPNDVILAPDVKEAFGHVSHSSELSFLSKYHKVITYGSKNGYIDYEQIEKLAKEYKPKLIIAGGSAYSRVINYERIKLIADSVNARTMADIAHISLLVAHNEHPSPIIYNYDYITSTTHKMLNGSRGGVIIYKEQYEKEITRGIIPFCQGGPLENMIYGKLVCFKEMNSEYGKKLAKQIKINAKIMSEVFIQNGIKIVSGGTDNHLMLIDLTNKEITGKELAEIFEECGVITNCNSLPGDKRSFFKTSGVRLGTPFITKRGLTENEVKDLAQGMANIVKLYSECKIPDTQTLKSQKDNLIKIVLNICENHPLRDFYPNRYKYLI